MAVQKEIVAWRRGNMQHLIVEGAWRTLCGVQVRPGHGEDHGGKPLGVVWDCDLCQVRLRALFKAYPDGAPLEKVRRV